MNNSNRYRRWTALFAVAVVGAALCACGGTPQQIKHYRLDVAPARADTAAGDRPVLSLEPFSADAAYDDSQIVYRGSPYELNYYYYHRWSAAPGLMLTDALRRGYEATGRFQSVTAGQSSRSDVILSGHVAAIEEIDISEEEWIGRVVLELRLRDARTGDLLWSEVVEEEEPLAERSPAGLAEAVSAAVTRIVETSAADIVSVARQSSAGLGAR